MTRTDKALIAVEDAIYAHVRPMAARAGIGEDDVQDLAQQVRIRLARYTIPRFDPSRGTKLSTYLIHAIRNESASQVRSFVLTRRTRRRRFPVDAAAPEIAISRGEGRLDRAIEQLSEQFRQNPEKFGLTRTQAAVFRAFDNAPPETPIKELAGQMGYAHTCNFSGAMGTIRQKVKDIDIEEYAVSRAA